MGLRRGMGWVGVAWRISPANQDYRADRVGSRTGEDTEMGRGGPAVVGGERSWSPDVICTLRYVRCSWHLVMSLRLATPSASQIDDTRERTDLGPPFGELDDRPAGDRPESAALRAANAPSQPTSGTVRRRVGHDRVARASCGRCHRE